MQTKKYICHYQYCSADGPEAGILTTGWAKISASVKPGKRITYQDAQTLLRRSIHRDEKKKNQVEITLLHLYDSI